MTEYRTLITAAELAGCLHDRDLRVFDCRHDLTEPQAGAQAYAEGHVPGAQFLHLDRDLSGPLSGRNGRHPLPDPDALAKRLGECGVTNTSQVVAYDEFGGIFAGRLWWLLRWLGHDRVALLDGGLAAWWAAGYPSTATREAPPAASFSYRLRPDTVDIGFVEGNLRTREALIIDARGPDRFRGENETLDPVAGHIPGAVNRHFRLNLSDDGRFKPAARLREEFQSLLGGRDPGSIVHSCGSGVTACHNLLAMEIAGLQGSRLYPGSWSEWCSDPSRPIATGPD
jgi:thiosulfate/3-mercaptopyruvate sulfurtransferase